MQLYKLLHGEYATVFKEIPDLLQSLQSKGIRLALATGKGGEACRFSLDTLGLASFFERVEAGSPQGSRKKEAIQQIIDSFEPLLQSQTIYVGDSAGDIKESYAAGIRPIAAAWAPTVKKDELEKEKPEQQFSTVSSFASWLYQNL